MAGIRRCISGIRPCICRRRAVVGGCGGRILRDRRGSSRRDSRCRTAAWLSRSTRQQVRQQRCGAIILYAGGLGHRREVGKDR